MRQSYILGLAMIALAAPATAQERSFNFALRGGVGTAPDYPGSNTYSAVPDLGFTFGALKWGRVNAGNGIGAIPKNGLSLRGAFKVIGSRSFTDNPELSFTQEIDTAVELGLGVAYQETNWLAFAEVRQGFGGHSGVTGTLGADLIMRPSDRWTITAGPRINLGNTEYASTYFGITPADAGRSPFPAYVADGGMLGAGLAVGATYRIDDKWAFESLVSYEKLMNDAADSPITAIGSEDQWTVRFGLSRAFTIRF